MFVLVLINNATFYFYQTQVYFDTDVSWVHVNEGIGQTTWSYRIANALLMSKLSSFTYHVRKYLAIDLWKSWYLKIMCKNSKNIS